MVVHPGVAAKNVAEFIALAALSRRPSLHPRATPGAPDVPTLAESGCPGLEVASWYGILAPAGTPQDILRKLNADINRILQSPDVRERLTALGTEPTGGTPEQFAETIKPTPRAGRGS